MYHPDLIRHPDSCPALVLNADYTPLSYYPLSLWPWQTAIKAAFLERVDIIAEYEREIHSPSRTMRLPSVIALRQYVRPATHPAFTRFNLFLRDRFRCQDCGSHDDLTFDHVIPRALGGRTTWENVATRSEEHTSELQSLMRISYAVFCLKKKKHTIKNS